MAEWSKQPLIMARADGVYIWDVDGKRYLDALSGIYVVAVGHNNRRVIEAIHRQLDTLHFSPPMHGTNPVAVQLANVLAELAPGDLSAVKFQCGGSEVTEAAIKLARQYHKLTGSPGKYKIISRYLSWHGSTMASLSASGLKSRKTVNEPLAPGFLHVFPPTCYRCPFGKNYPDCGITCATLITGSGRTGRMFAAETFGVTPDILCVGKGLAGGYAPLSAMICKRAIADVFWGPVAVNPGFVEGHTFEGNPISCAAGMAVLQEILERDLCANARVQGARLRAGLERVAEKHKVIGDVRGKGLFQGIEFVRSLATKEPFPAD